MAKAGTAYITFRADFSELRKDLARAVGDIEGRETDVRVKADTSDLKRAKSDIRDFDKRAKAAQESVKDFSVDLGDANDRINLLGSSIGRANRNFAFLRNTLRLIKWPALITGAGAAAQGISALAAGAAGLTGALTPLSGLLAGYPALLGALGQAAGVTALAGVTDLTEALAGNEEALKRLSPEAKRFMKTLQQLEPEYRKLQKTAQRNLFGGAGAGLKDALRNFPALQKVIAATADAMGDLARRTGQFVGRSGFGRDFQTIGKGNARILEQMGRAGLNFADALRHVMVEAQPLLEFLGDSTIQFSKFVEEQAKAGRQSGRMAKFFRQTENIFERLVSIGASVASTFREIGKAGAPLGRDILRALDEGANHLERWATSVEGRNSLRDYFADAKPAIFEAGRLIRDAGRGFFELGNTPGLAKLIRQVRVELLPVLIDMTEQTTKAFGPELVKFAVQFGRLMSNFVGASGPLTLVVKGMTEFLKLTNTLIDASPFLKGFVTSFVGAAAVLKTIDFAKTISGFDRIKKAIVALGESRLGQQIGENLSDGLTAARGKLRSAGQRLRDVFLRAFAAVRTFAVAATEAVGTFIGQFVGTIRARSIRFRNAGKIAGRAFGVGMVLGLVIAIIEFDDEIEKWVDKHLPGVMNTSLRDLVKKIDFGILTRAFGDAMRTVAKIVSRAWKIITDVTRDAVRPIRRAARTIGNTVQDSIGDAFKFIIRVVQNSMRKVISVFRPAARVVAKIARGMGKAIHNVLDGIRNMFRNLGGVLSKIAGFISKVVNKIIDALGKLKDKIPDITPSLPSLPSIGDITGGLGLATGGIVPGSGSGDKVPLFMGRQLVALVEPGEYVSVANRTATAALMQHNAAVPRRAAGGIVALGKQLRREGYEVGENPAFGGVTPGAHVPNSLHYSGQALDVNDDLTPYASGGGEPGSLDRLYNRLKGMAGVIELLWRVPNHYDHLHVGMAKGAAGNLGGFKGGKAPQIPAFKIKGKGRIADIARRAGEIMRETANDYLSRLGGPGETGGVGGFKGINSIAKFIPYWNKVNPQWERYASRFATIVSRESSFNPRAINHIGLGHAGWYQYDPPTWRAYDQGAGNPSWPAGPFNPGLATQHTGTMLDHEGASTFSRWAATDPGAKHGGIVAHLAQGGPVTIPGFNLKEKPGLFLPKLLRLIKLDKKDASKKLGDKVSGLINDDDPLGFGLGQGMGLSKRIIKTTGLAEYNAEAANISAETGRPYRGRLEVGWLGEQLKQLLQLHGLLNTANTYIFRQAIGIQVMIEYTRAMLKVRLKVIKKLEAWKKTLSKQIGSAKGNRKKRLQNRMKWVNDQIKAEGRVVTSLKNTVAPGLAEEKIGAIDALSSIRSSIVDLVGLTGDGGQIFDVRQAMAETGAVLAGDTAEAFRIEDLIRFAEAVRFGGFDSQLQFAGGGIVPGPSSRAVPVIAHGQETIRNEAQEEMLQRRLGGGTGPVFADIYIGGEKIAEHVQAELREDDRQRDISARMGAIG